MSVYKELKDKAKNLGIRVTKVVDGRRRYLTASELRREITKNFNNRVQNTRKVIRICKDIVVSTGTAPAPAPPPPPPPPSRPPPKPVINNKRAKLMAELKTTLKKRGLSNKN